MKKIAIFKTGKHTATNGKSLNVTADFIRQVVTSYDPKQHEAPAVIGHPKDNSPAYGWVESLEFDEAKGILYAKFKQLEQQFIKLIKAGRFKKRSASFYSPNHPLNPTKGKPYLRHVGFLGAMPPAVKGLADFDFSEDKNCLTYEFSLPNDQLTNQLMENKTMPKQDYQVTQALDFAEREAKLLEREQAIEAREQRLAKQAEQELYNFTDSLIKQGKIVPAERETVLSFLTDVDNADHVFSFSDNGVPSERSGIEAFKAILERLSPVIDFSERSASDPNTAEKPKHSLNMVSDDELLAQQIQTYADKHNLDYAEAVQQFNGVI